MRTKLIIETPMTDLDTAINRWLSEASNEKVYFDGDVPFGAVAVTEGDRRFYYELNNVVQIIYQQSIIQAYELDGKTQKPQTLRSALIYYR